MHVFADLQPYICTFDDCRSMLLTFPNRMTWSQHELTKHRICQSWTCHLCAGTFSADATFVKHLQLKHDIPLHHCTILAASSVTKATEPGASTNKQCPLCRQKGWSNHRRFITHLGRHLEEIALSVLPREVDSDSDQRRDADEVSDDATLCLDKDGLLESPTKKHKETHERPGSSYNDDTDGSRPATQLSTSTLDGATPARPLIGARSVSQQSSSYWSVPETHYFPKLIEYFGTDWAGISTFIETKTSNMVSMSPVPALFKQSLVNYRIG
jgi:hypothetical protein